MKNAFVSHLRRSTFFRYLRNGMFCFFVHMFEWVVFFVFVWLASQFPSDVSNACLVELLLVGCNEDGDGTLLGSTEIEGSIPGLLLEDEAADFSFLPFLSSEGLMG